MQQSPRPPQAARRARSLRTVVALVLREIGASNGRSALGYLWAVIEPVAAVVLFTVLFSLIMRSPPLGESFPLFYASGILPYLLFVDIAAKVGGAVRFSRPLLAFPGVTWLDAVLARFLLAALTRIVIHAAVLVAIIAIYDLDPLFRYDHLALGLMVGMFMGLAVGLVNCILFHLVPVWSVVWGLINRPLLFASGVIVPVESVPQPWQDWLAWNPLAHVVAITRMGIYPTYRPDHVSMTYLAAVILALIPAGLFLMRRYWRELIDPAA